VNQNQSTEAAGIAVRIEKSPGALTAPQLAIFLGMSRTAIYDMAANGRIPHFRIGSSIRFDPAVTARWLRSREVATGSLPRNTSTHHNLQEQREAA
jgi:excisionase family DNA binding protein